MTYQLINKCKLAIIIVFNLSISASCLAQNIREIISAEQIRTFTTLELFASTLGFPAQNGATAFKILYTTLDLQDEVDTASGLLLIPDGVTGALPMMLNQHGTTSPTAVPSELEIFSTIAGYIFVGQGYITMIPDMLGLGEARGFHPYLHAETQASVAVDLLYVIRDYLPSVGVSWNGELFLSGYSQGGHASMAAQRELEENHAAEFPVVAAAHMSGPYQPASLLNLLLDPEATTCCPTYGLYLLLAYQEVYGNIYSSLDEVLKPEFIPAAELFFSDAYKEGLIDPDSINIRITGLALAEGAAFAARTMFTDAFVEEIESNPVAPFRLALEDNDMTDWTPIAPIFLPYCRDDDFVDARNTLIADSAFRERGVSVEIEDVGSELGHIECFFPASLAAIDFFNQFTTSITDLLAPGSAIQVYPNPVQETLHIEWELRKAAQVRISLIDPLGRTIIEEPFRQVAAGKYRKEWTVVGNSFPAKSKGIYFLQIQIDDQFIHRPIQIN